MYMMVALLVCLAFYLFTLKRYFWFSIVLALLGLTDYVALFILPVFFVLSKNKFKLLLTFVPLAICYLIWLPVFLNQLTVGLLVKNNFPVWWETLGNLSLKNLSLIPVKFILGRISFDNNFLYIITVLISVGIYGYLILREGFKSKVLWFWMLIPIIIGIFISIKIPTLSYFRYLLCLPPMYILVSRGLFQLKTKQRIIFIILTLSINILSSTYYLFNPIFHRENWRGAVAKIGPDTIVTVSESQKEALMYYQKTTVNINNLEQGSKKVWLIRYVWPINDPESFAPKLLEGLGYNKDQEWDFRGVEFWEYSKI